MCDHGGSDNRDLLGRLRGALDALRAAADVPLGGAVADVELTHALQLLEAVVRVAKGRQGAVVREIASRQAHRGQGAHTTEDLLARTLRMSPGEARREAELAEGLALVPETAKALADGRIGLGQAQVAVKKAVEVKDRSDGELLVKQIDAVAATVGQEVDRNRLAREIDAELAKANVDVLAERERIAFQRRNLAWLVRDGMHVLHAELDAVGGTRVRAMLDRLSDKTGERDTRTFSQRQCDALVQLATLAQDGRGKARGTLQSATVLLITSPEALHGKEGAEPAVLDGHGPVSTSLAQQMCCDATVQVVATDRNGNILDVGRQERLPTPRQRAAVIARDKACVGCDAPISQCQIHHIKWWSKRGLTDLDNLALVCWRCHTHLHQHHWQITKQGGRYRAGPPETSGATGRIGTELLDKLHTANRGLPNRLTRPAHPPVGKRSLPQEKRRLDVRWSRGTQARGGRARA